jgi:ABC-2 type transport system permease protein
MIRDPKILISMIIVPLILTGIMYAATVSFVGQVAREAARKGGIIIVVDMDHGNWTSYALKMLEKQGYRIVQAGNVSEAVWMAEETNVLGVIVFPHGFSNNITRLKPGHIVVYSPIRSISMLAVTSAGRIQAATRIIENNITSRIIVMHGLPVNFTRQPLRENRIVILKNRLIETRESIDAIIGPLIMSVIMIPILVIVLAGFIAQLSATSIAVEKEEKMLETLLSLPMSRGQLIAAKITASAIVGLIGLAAYLGMLGWYFASLMSVGSTSSGVSIGSIFSGLLDAVGSYTIISLIATLTGLVILILGLSILLALFVEDVRSAQLVSAYVITPLAFLVFIALIIDPLQIGSTGRIIVSLIPMVNAGFIIPTGYIGDYISPTIAMISTFTYAGIVIWFASRIISTEKIFTIRLFKRKKGFTLLGWRRG